MSQTILADSPLNWLMERRVEANYKAGRFGEPAVPDHFRQLHKAGIQRSVAEYMNEILFAFDPDHAMLAFPLQAISVTSKTIEGTAYRFDGDQFSFLTSSFRLVKKRPLTEISRLFTAISAK